MVVGRIGRREGDAAAGAAEDGGSVSKATALRGAGGRGGGTDGATGEVAVMAGVIGESPLS